jgi:hypothetical protein
MNILAKAFLLSLFLTGIVAGQTPDSPFLISDIKATEVSPGVVNVQLTTTTLRPIAALPTVPVANGAVLLTGTIPLQQLLESDILGSSLATDLNGDGRLDQVLIRQTDKGLRFDGALVEPMGDQTGRQQPYRANGEMRRYLLSPDAPDFSVLYYTPPSLGLLLEDRAQPLEVLELPNPHLQLVVFEHSDPVDGLRFLPDAPTFGLTIDGKEPARKRLLFAWEPELFRSLNLSPRWLRAWWIAVPLDSKPGATEHSLQVKVGQEHSALGLYAQINYAVESGVRMSTNRSVGVIWSPPQH